MFEKPLRLLSILCTVFVLLSFAFFAIDQSRAGSQSSQRGIAADGPPPALVAGQAQPAPKAKRHGVVRRAIDDVDRRLVDPFNGLAAGSSNDWVKRGIPTLFALLVYGFGLSFIARYAGARA
jgi:hypothetical protein